MQMHQTLWNMTWRRTLFWQTEKVSSFLSTPLLPRVKWVITFWTFFQVMNCLEKASWWSNSLPCDTCLLTHSLLESFSIRIMNKRYLTAGCLQISPQTTLKAQMFCKWKISTSSTAWSPSLTFLRRSSKSNEFENYFSSVIVRLLIRSRKKAKVLSLFITQPGKGQGLKLIILWKQQ